MKLSMWMIANRLSGFAMDVSIRESAPAVLRSARRAYSTDCVHVYQEGDALVCSGEGDTIRLYNVSLAEGFEIIQGIFDFYEDWSEALEQAIRSQDYQKTAELGFQVFQNPLLIMDGNNRLLGITRQYGPDSMDSEWQYLCTYGYTSMNAAQQLQYNAKNVAFWRRGIQRYEASKGAALQYGGMSYGMFCADAFCGRVTLLEKERRLNRGDAQLLEYLCVRLEPILGHSFSRDMMRNINVFHQLLLGQAYDQMDLDFQLQYQNWSREDIYSLALMDVSSPDRNRDLARDADMLMHVILSQTRGCVVIRQSTRLLILSNRYLAADGGMQLFFQSLGRCNPIRVSFSLPCRRIENAGLLLRQASYAMDTGMEAHPEQRFFDCFDCAVDFILESPSLRESLHACMPAVRQLWELQGAGGEQFQTLKAFLEHERSISRTSEALFTHRNTVIYRLKRIEELLGRSLDDPYIRDYARLSIQIIELWNRRNSGA